MRNCQEGYTLLELIVVIMILGVLTSATATILIGLVSSFELSQNKNSVGFVSQQVLTRISDEVRQGISSPDSLRPRVSSNGLVLRFYRSPIFSDSIRYYFSTSGSDTFLFRSHRNSAGVLVPSFSSGLVNFVKGKFSVDGLTTGFSTTGRVNLSLKVGRIYGSEPDSNSFSLEVHSRNY